MSLQQYPKSRDSLEILPKRACEFMIGLLLNKHSCTFKNNSYTICWYAVFIIKPVLVKLRMDLLWFYVPRPTFHAGRYCYVCGTTVTHVALILKAIAPCMEDRSDHVTL